MTYLPHLAALAVSVLALAGAAQAEPGMVYTYERSNTDGSNLETVTVYHAADHQLEVMKYRARCTGAALVTAEIDPQTRSAERLIGGRLLPEAQVQQFAFFNRDPASGVATVQVNLPDQTLNFEAVIPDDNWILYDFDLSALTVTAVSHVRSRSDFAFGVALMWADPSDPGMRYLGSAEASFAAEERHEGQNTLRYDVAGPAFDASGGGTLWLDPANGHVINAQFGAPNHPGYEDFRLRLIGVETMGAAQWNAHLTSHYAGCP